MKKRSVLVSALLVCCMCGLNAQDIPNQEEEAKKKEINNLKLSETVVYADVIQLASDDKEAITLAQQKSIAMMQTHVIEIFAKRLGMKKEDVKEIWDVIDDKCQNIVVKKGDLFRVFSYIAKDALGLGPKKPKEEDVKKYLGDDTDKKTAKTDTTGFMDDAKVITDVMTGGKDSINVLPPVQPKVDTTESKSNKSTTQTTASVNPNPEVPQPAPEQKDTTEYKVPEPPIVVPDPKPELDPKPEPDPKPAPEVVIPQLCQTMIDKANFKDLGAFLTQEKKYQKLMFGSSRQMQNLEKCYVVVVDKSTQKIVGVLDKGVSERMNFITKQMDNYKNYRGNYAVIFVQEY